MLKGGKVVGKGTYGCVYKPPMKCKGEVSREKNTISKLMDKSEAVKEVKEVSFIDNIDPDYEFHVKLQRICDPGIPISGVDYTIGEDGSVINTCPMLDDVLNQKGQSNIMNSLRNKDLKLVKYEDGGVNLATFIGSKTDSLKDDTERSLFFLKLFLSMENLFKGLVIMDRHEFCHFDIKLENIVIKPDNNMDSEEDTNSIDDSTLFSLKFIDFGMSRTFKDIPTRSVFHNAYFAWPLETMMFIPNIYNGINSEDVQQRMLSAFEKSFAAKISTQTIDSRTMDPYTMTIMNEDVLSNYIRDITGYGGPKKDKSEMFNEMTSKIDTFSMGIVLLECWANILKIYFYNSDATDVLLESFTHREIFDEIQELILNMIRPYYGIRYNSEQAYNKFLSIKALILNEDEFKSTRVSSKSILTDMKTRLSEGSPDISVTDQSTIKRRTTRRTKRSSGNKITRKKNKKQKKLMFKNTPDVIVYTPQDTNTSSILSKSHPTPKLERTSGKTKSTFFADYMSPETTSESSFKDDITPPISYSKWLDNSKTKKTIGFGTHAKTGTEKKAPMFIGKTVLFDPSESESNSTTEDSNTEFETQPETILQKEKKQLLGKHLAIDPYHTNKFNVPTMPSMIDI